MLLLVQHGKNFPESIDPRKGLTDEGIAEVQRVTDLLKFQGIRVDRILHSGKTRARQTAELLAEALSPTNGVMSETGLGPLDDVASAAKRFSGEAGETALMIVGHLPFLSKLAGYLLFGNPDTGPFQFQNGGVLCLDRPTTDDPWKIRWALVPNP